MFISPNPAFEEEAFFCVDNRSREPIEVMTRLAALLLCCYSSGRPNGALIRRINLRELHVCGD